MAKFNKKSKSKGSLDKTYLNDKHGDHVLGYSRQPVIEYVTTSKEKKLRRIRKEREQQFASELKTRAKEEYFGLRDDIEGDALLKAMGSNDPNIIRYVRLEEDVLNKKAKKYLGEGWPTVTNESYGNELSYVRTKISEKKDEMFDDSDLDDLDELEDELEEQGEDELEDELEEVDSLEYIRTNITSRTDITSDDVRDVLTERDAYFTDNIKNRNTSVSDIELRENLKEEYLVVGRTSISSKKYSFRKISEASAPVQRKPGKSTYRLALEKDNFKK